MVGTVHIIGAGLAGLSAAVHLADQAKDITVHETTDHGGGRCRSFYDDKLGCRIDNGNHLLLSGNTATLDYLKRIGSGNSLVGPDNASFPFIDLKTSETWHVTPDKGIIPWSLLSKGGRVPGTAFGEYMRGLSLAFASPDKTVSDCLAGQGLLFERFWEPLSVSVLNTEANKASARLLWPVMRETFGRGASACVPLIVRDGLSESFIDPAIAYLQSQNAKVSFNHRLKSFAFSNGKVSALSFSDQTIEIAANDQVILAVPPTIAGALLPGLQVPDDFRPIVNGHFRIPTPRTKTRFMGLVGGYSHWLFIKDDIASITISAATDIVSQSNDWIAETLWKEICVALELGNEKLGDFRIVKEKRATFAQTPEQIKKRPKPKTAYQNLFLAGDWTDNGLPATIEGTIRTGKLAADLACG